MVLFAVLPWGVRSQQESGRSRRAPTPARRRRTFWRKLFWTTVMAAVVFGILAVIYKENLITLEYLKRICQSAAFLTRQARDGR